MQNTDNLAQVDDLQTYILDQFFYGSIIETWSFGDSLYQKFISTYQQKEKPIARVTYEDSFRDKGLSGRVLSSKGMKGSIKLNFDTTTLSQAY